MKEKLLIATWPVLCEDCGKDLTQKVVERQDLDVITVYCPHNHLVAMAYAGEAGGSRAIFRWDIVGPINQAEAESMIQKLGQASATFENLDAPRLH
jgi:hypothetical protein